MKTRSKYLLGLTSVLGLVLLGVYGMRNVDSLKGTFGIEPVSTSAWRLNALSPSGRHSISMEDTVFVFSISNTSPRDIVFEDGTHFDFTFNSSTSDINIGADGDRALLYSIDPVTGVALSGHGYIVANTSGENPTIASASIYMNNTSWWPLEVGNTGVPAGAIRDYALVVDSGNLIDGEAGESDIFDVSVAYNGETMVVGSPLSY